MGRGQGFGYGTRLGGLVMGPGYGTRLRDCGTRLRDCGTRYRVQVWWCTQYPVPGTHYHHPRVPTPCTTPPPMPTLCPLRAVLWPTGLARLTVLAKRLTKLAVVLARLCIFGDVKDACRDWVRLIPVPAMAISWSGYGYFLVPLGLFLGPVRAWPGPVMAWPVPVLDLF